MRLTWYVLIINRMYAHSWAHIYCRCKSDGTTEGMVPYGSTPPRYNCDSLACRAARTSCRRRRRWRLVSQASRASRHHHVPPTSGGVQDGPRAGRNQKSRSCERTWTARAHERRSYLFFYRTQPWQAFARDMGYQVCHFSVNNWKSLRLGCNSKRTSGRSSIDYDSYHSVP